ncbi:GNAT family N-acetyltransferase [Microbacterium sp. W4I20]|uniref:GNAT family N-acetyltransferase n=1 Tax=Microbacterium sp. W4I20 TaxID=3042262 RepID=UPI002783F66E|nr:GNAT family N-acetyltransferase [Microbacterium sp. W4I20]MDQ0726501.1 GNAT superfamily N-acetyltransferase [Microbacterium sp. W4I20]
MSSPEYSGTQPAFTLSALTVPESIHSPDAADFIGMAVVRNTVEAEQRGASTEVFTAEELLPTWKDENTPLVGFVAKVGGRVVARGNVALPVGAGECWAAVSVLPEYRNRGIGSALYERLEQVARSEGRMTVQNQTSFAADALSGATHAAPTGFGAVPAELTSTRFLHGHGFSLEQVGRLSGLSLPVDPQAFSALLADAEAAADGYRTVSWQGRTPEDWLQGIALVRTRMSTDAPNAGIEQTEDVWTADRVRAMDDRWESSPRTRLTTIAVDDGTGQIAGFTELDVPPEPHRPVEQIDTLVLRDHRGHRLGMLMKLTNIRELGDRFPDHVLIETMNAEENRHMLDVNEAVGFVPLSYAARWKKVIGRE